MCPKIDAMSDKMVENEIKQAFVYANKIMKYETEVFVNTIKRYQSMISYDGHAWMHLDGILLGIQGLIGICEMYSFSSVQFGSFNERFYAELEKYIKDGNTYEEFMETQISEKLARDDYIASMDRENAELLRKNYALREEIANLKNKKIRSEDTKHAESELEHKNSLVKENERLKADLELKTKELEDLERNVKILSDNLSQYDYITKSLENSRDKAEQEVKELQAELARKIKPELKNEQIKELDYHTARLAQLKQKVDVEQKETDTEVKQHVETNNSGLHASVTFSKKIVEIVQENKDAYPKMVEESKSTELVTVPGKDKYYSAGYLKKVLAMSNDELVEAKIDPLRINPDLIDKDNTSPFVYNNRHLEYRSQHMEFIPVDADQVAHNRVIAVCCLRNDNYSWWRHKYTQLIPAIDGFLYEYDAKKDKLFLAVYGGKFQSWKVPEELKKEFADLS